jgi:hypothetical protein
MATSTHDTPQLRQAVREEIAAQVAEFLANGGQIDVREAPEGYCENVGNLAATDVTY